MSANFWSIMTIWDKPYQAVFAPIGTWMLLLCLTHSSVIWILLHLKYSDSKSLSKLTPMLTSTLQIYMIFSRVLTFLQGSKSLWGEEKGYLGKLGVKIIRFCLPPSYTSFILSDKIALRKMWIKSYRLQLDGHCLFVYIFYDGNLHNIELPTTKRGLLVNNMGP